MRTLTDNAMIPAQGSMSRRGFLRLAGLTGGAALMTTLLGGCAESRTSEAQQSNQSSSAAVEAEPSSAAQASAASAAAGGNVLIAYFSWSGNTEIMAERIHEDVPGSTLFRIEPATPYTTDYNAVVDQAQQELNDDYIPPLAANVPDFDRYDTVFVGYPLWWYHVPQVVKGFLESNDWAGKTVVPFETHGGGGWSQNLSDVEAGTPGATMLEGLALSGSSISSHLGEVDQWVSTLGL